MIRPTVLRNSAEPEIVIGIALKIFYQANDWISNSEFLDQLDKEYDAINKARESRTGGQAIAKYKPALYYGLLDVREDGAHRINEYGRKYFEAYASNNEDDRVDCLISSISSHKFGSNNPAVPESRSRIEPPKVFLVSCLLLNNKLSKTEYAYILENLAKDRDYQKILVDVSLSRLKGNSLEISEYAKNNYRDDKGLKFLSDAGFFNDIEKGTKAIKEKYLIKYSEALSSLSVLADNETVGTTNAISVPNMNTNNNTMLINYLNAIRTKPFILLAGISGTGKSRIVRELAFKSCPKYLQDKEGVSPGNYCMIEVKPNWHDSTELLGYYSNLSNGYQFKKFVKFLVKAKMNHEVPFFVCLDEMNLAPVEQYFAEILSILETRKHPKNPDTGEVDLETIKTEIVVENKYFKERTWKDKDGAIHEKVNMTDKDWYEYFFDVETMTEEEKQQVLKYEHSRTLQEEGLTLPDNVVIIGTVNMDDTTHQFSRKVIDRAMTIEMNGGNLRDMFGGSKNLEYIKDEEEQQKWQHAFSQRYVTADEVLEAHPEYAEEIIEKLPERLEDINMALKGTPFEVSYRVLNELTIMVGVMLDNNEEEAELVDIINQAINNILLMKILPRIEGDAEMFALSSNYKKKMGVNFDNRLEWLKDLAPKLQEVPEDTTPEEEDGSAEETTEDERIEHQQTAADKIQEMIDRLDNQDFTRFWP